MITHPRLWIRLLAVCVLVAASSPRVHAQSFNEHFSGVVPGGVTFTGNTLGLSGSAVLGLPGTNHSIGMFISRNPASPGEVPGTTVNWQENGSGAVLRLPEGATIRYAELIWSGNGRVLDNSVLDHINDAVSLTLPSGQTVLVTPDGPADAADDTVGRQTYYTQRADVTALIRPFGAGSYIVSGVPAVLDTRSSETAVGWTLAVVYTAPGLPLRAISLRTGLNPITFVTGSGVTTPVDFALTCLTATPHVKLLVSALEGDSNPERDVLTMKVDAAAAVQLSGPNNRATNFFGSQINGDDGKIDTSGWFGDRNHNPWPTPAQHAIAGRQGWDITALDLTGQVPAGAATVRIQGSDAGGSDDFVLVAAALQADVDGPVVDITLTGDPTHPVANEIVTYTATVTNPNAFGVTGLEFNAATTAHLAFVPNSVRVNGEASASPTPVNLPLDPLAGGAQHVIEFQARVLAMGSAADPVAAWSQIRHVFTDCGNQHPEVIKLSNVVKGVYGPALLPSAGIAPFPIRTGDIVTVEYGIKNIGGEPATAATFHGYVPAGTTYVPGTTRVDGESVADVGGTMPFLTPQAVPGGGVAVGATRHITFQVRVDRGTALITATLRTDLDGEGPAAPETTNGAAPVDNREPPLYTYIAAPSLVTPGDAFKFTAFVNNLTLDPIAGLTLDFDLPAGVTFKPGVCAALPCAIPALVPGQIATLAVDFIVANPFPNGTLTATVRIRDAQGVVLSLANATVSILGRARYFAEGASNSFFKTEFSVVNPTAQTETVKFRFLRDNGDTRTHLLQLGPSGRAVIDPQRLLGEELGAFSTVVESSDTIGVERVMTWDASSYGSSADNGVVSPGTTWYFAEGATGAFQLFYLLENPDSARTSQVSIAFLRADSEPVVKLFTVGPNSRLTIPVHEIAGLEQAEVSAIISVTNGVPIVADRAMYRSPNGQPFGAGHASSGSLDLSASWYFGEGATGDFFDTYLLLANPHDGDVAVTVRYQLPGGENFTKNYAIPAHRRLTVVVEDQDPRLAATPVAMSVTAAQPIVAERAMWWPGPQDGPAWWSEAHAALGATQTAPRWAVASGATGGPTAESTYVLISNASETAGEVVVTLVLDNQASATKTLTLAGLARLTVDVATEFPQTDGHSFSLIVQGKTAADTPLPLVVERSHYASPNGVFWAAGDVTLATPVP